MQLKDIHDEWEKDGDIDSTRITEESRRIPKLHNKYLRYLSEVRINLEALLILSDEKEQLKTLYLTGKLTPEQLKEYNLPIPHNKLLKSDVENYLKADKEMNELRMKIAIQKEKMKTLEEIVSSINYRQQNIRNIIEWQKFTSGSA